jgi:hypothetical protein
MRDAAEKSDPKYDLLWEGGAKTLFNKGTNGRWCDLFSADELALYDAAARRELTPGCRGWLENGGLWWSERTERDAGCVIGRHLRKCSDSADGSRGPGH